MLREVVLGNQLELFGFDGRNTFGPAMVSKLTVSANGKVGSAVKFMVTDFLHTMFDDDFEFFNFFVSNAERFFTRFIFLMR